jgi:translocation and assembly module TamB
MGSPQAPRPPGITLRRILLWTLAVLLLLPVALIALVLLVANIDPGRRLIEREAASLTGGTVVLHGLSGRFPDALLLAHAELHDTEGVWLSVDDVALDWSPLALIGGVASIQRLAVGHIAVPRLAVADPNAKPAPPSKGGFSLPVRVVVDKLAVGRLDLGAPLAGEAASVKVAGKADVASLAQARVTLAIDRLDGVGRYRLDAVIDPKAIAGKLAADEPPGGLIGGLAKLPDLGALSVAASIDGPRSAERTDVSATAGALKAGAHGTIDLAGQAATLEIDVAAPAMRPRPDAGWQSVQVHAHVSGPFKRPDAAAHIAITGFEGGGAKLASLVADLGGNQGAVDLHAVLGGLVLPGPKPDLFAAAPLDLVAHVDLDRPDRPVRFALKHPLVSADGTASTGGDIAARIHTVVPDLAPLAAIGGVDIKGRTEAVATLATHGQASDVAVDGTATFTGGQAPVPALLGDTTYGVTASLTGQDIAISRAKVDGRAIHADVTGTDRGGALDLAWHVLLTDLAAASPQAKGRVEASGHVQGPPSGLAVQADIKGDVGTAQVPKGPVTVALRVQGLPANPSGTVSAKGMLAGSALGLDASVDKLPDGGFHAVLKKADWKSLAATADLVLAKGAALPLGRVSAKMTRLADLSALAGQSLGGSFVLGVQTTQAGGRPDAKIDLQARGLQAQGSTIGSVSLVGHVADPAGKPDAALVLTADGIDANGITGGAKVSVAGPQTALAIKADSALHGVAGADAIVSARALLDASAKTVTLQALAADYKTEALRLRAPARIAFGSGLSVDQLRLALGQATIDVAGRISPALALTAQLRNVTPDLARPFAPSLSAQGVLSADARLSGTAASPQGSVRIQATGFRMRSGPAASIPVASLHATIGLDGATARIDGRLAAGPKLNLTVAGSAPIKPGAALDLHAGGRLDLTLLDPILGATGERAAGNIALDATVTGTTAAPRIAGGVTLASGELQDFAQGLHITDIAARIDAQGDTMRISSFTAKAGPGTLSASGSIGVLAPDLPVDLHLVAKNARPLASDLLTAFLDADISVEGHANGAMKAAGKIFVRRADINIPDSLPPSVAVLNVRRPGDKPPPPPSASASVVSLAISVDAPNSVFVRGHGLDSEMGGTLTVGGTTGAPQVGGGFDMRRGDFSLAGTTLTFSKGSVGFDGTGVNNKLDPTLDFVADSTSGGVTATLTITGYADAPKIALSSSPTLPQDEVLAHLLFGVSVKDLSALQIAEIGAALAEISGATGGGPGVLGSLRKGLGLDRLSVGGGSGSTGATVEAGRYVARGVYVGAKQPTSGGGTTAEVQIDLTKRLKATAQLATGGGSVQGSTPENDTGTSVGLSYQFEY